MVWHTRSAGSRLISLHRRPPLAARSRPSPSTVSASSAAPHVVQRPARVEQPDERPDRAGGVVVLGLAQQQRRAPLDVAQVHVVAQGRADDPARAVDTASTTSGSGLFHFDTGCSPTIAPVAHRRQRLALGEHLGVRPDADLEILAPQPFGLQRGLRPPPPPRLPGLDVAQRRADQPGDPPADRLGAFAGSPAARSSITRSTIDRAKVTPQAFSACRSHGASSRRASTRRIRRRQRPQRPPLGRRQPSRRVVHLQQVAHGGDRAAGHVDHHAAPQRHHRRPLRLRVPDPPDQRSVHDLLSPARRRPRVPSALCNGRTRKDNRDRMPRPPPPRPVLPGWHARRGPLRPCPRGAHPEPWRRHAPARDHALNLRSAPAAALRRTCCLRRHGASVLRSHDSAGGGKGDDPGRVLGPLDGGGVPDENCYARHLRSRNALKHGKAAEIGPVSTVLEKAVDLLAESRTERSVTRRRMARGSIRHPALRSSFSSPFGSRTRASCVGATSDGVPRAISSTSLPTRRERQCGGSSRHS